MSMLDSSCVAPDELVRLWGYANGWVVWPELPASRDHFGKRAHCVSYQIVVHISGFQDCVIGIDAADWLNRDIRDLTPDLVITRCMLPPGVDQSVHVVQFCVDRELHLHGGPEPPTLASCVQPLKELVDIES